MIIRSTVLSIKLFRLLFLLLIHSDNWLVLSSHHTDYNPHHHHHTRRLRHSSHPTTMRISEDDITKWEQINFVSPQSQLTQSQWWQEETFKFQAKGMDHLYLLTQFVINWLQPTGLPNGVIREDLIDYPLETVQENQLKLFTHFWGVILASTVALCLAVIIPLIGLLLCLCCCNIRSSKRAKPNERDSALYITTASNSSPVHHQSRRKRRAKYKTESGCDPFVRSICTVTMFSLLLFISFFVICAFVTNEYIRSGVSEAPNKFNQSLDGFKLYLQNTQVEVNTLLRTNFQQLEEQMSSSLNKSGIIVKNRLAEKSKAVALENLTEIVTKLDNIHLDLKQLFNLTNSLIADALRLEMGLDKTRKNLETVFRYCLHPVCQALERRYRSRLSHFRVSRLRDLPDLEPIIRNISDLLHAGLISEVKRGKSAFDRISYEIQTAVNGTIPEIKHQVAAVGRDLSGTADDINRALDLPKDDIDKAKIEASKAAKFVQKYDIYRHWAGLGAAAVLALIFTSYTLGLLCGVCKKQPTYNEYRNRRVKPPSSCPFKFGIFFFFLSFGILLIATITLFITGTFSDRVGCHYMENPSDPQTRRLVDIIQSKFDGTIAPNYLTVIRGDKPHLTDVLADCHLNASLYSALRLNKISSVQIGKNGKVIEGLNLTDLLEFRGRNKIEARLKRFLSRVDFDPSSIVFLSPKAYSLLERLRDTSIVTLDFSSFFDLAHQEVTPLDLHAISNDLAQEAKNLPQSQLNYSSELWDISIKLQGYDKYLKEIHESMNNLQKAALRIKSKAQYGNKNLKEALSELIKQAKNAQVFIERNGKNAIRDVAEGFVRDLSALIDQYSEHIVDEVEHRLGRCGPVSLAYNVSTLAICKEIVLPYNGYWFSMASTLLLLLPATICASVLANLFQRLRQGRSHRYIEADSDLTLDNLEEDDIPLAHVVKQTDYPYENRRNPPIYPSTSAPSAPMHREDWLTSASQTHMFARPPPYNFSSAS
ncbi:prominin-like [Brevipalpus obovatus]|uniref:prominin-like n=1 Tax=Brevipalpus obovatus TaxID=246614 RepID=UPI003D9EACD8